MVETLEKLEKEEVVKSDLENRPYETYQFYDVSFVQEKFKLPERKKDFKVNFFTFLYESSLLSFYCLRDRRFKQVSSVVFKLIKQIRKKNLNAPSLVLNAFFELGSTFIKIGQFLLTRGDLLPKEYIDALTKLQDSLPPVSYEDIKSSIENELRNPLDFVYEYFDPKPIASASIGQVHRAKLINSSEVVVKVQRPDLNILFYQDLAILRCLAAYLERYTKIGKDREWTQIIDEIGRTLFEEIDFIQEGRNADRFRKNLRYEERIYIPKVFWKHTTRKLITIEFVPGIKITDIETLKENNINPKELALVLVNAYFKQFFEDGFYHTNPHPGNIIVKKDGTIVFYDFGMVRRINENIRKELGNILISIIGNDTDTLLNTLKSLDLIKSEVDIKLLKRVIEEAAYNFNEIEDDLEKLFEEKSIKLPSKFAYTHRMTGVLEGVARTLDPDFSLTSVAKPYFQDWIKDKLPGKIFDKIKIYLEVIKELPQYVSNIKKLEKKELQEKPNETIRVNLLNLENDELKNDVMKFYYKWQLANGVILLFCLQFIGTFLANRQSITLNILGFITLTCTLIGTVWLVVWTVSKRKMIE